MRPGSAVTVSSGGQLAVGAQLCCRVLWWTLSAGPWLLDEFVCGETQDEHLRNLILTSTDVDDDGPSCDAASAELEWQNNLDLPMQCEQSTILRQLKFGMTLRVSSM